MSLGDMNYGKRHPKVTNTCLICNKKFIVIYARRYKKYCSAKCGYKETSNKRKLNNPGGFTERLTESFYKKDYKKYNAIHRNWVKTHLKRKNICSKCGISGTNKDIQWANISDKYKKDSSDWKELCRKCHWWFDKKKYDKGIKLL
jgi:hypothetical protein